MFKEMIRNYEPQNAQEIEEKAMTLDYINRYGDFLLDREQRIAHMTASGIVLNEEMDHMLMIHHNIYNTWAWTGGHADGDDNLYEVAYREVKEETGIEEIKPLTEEALSIDILPVLGHVRRGKFVGTHLHINMTYVFIGDMMSKVRHKADENSGVKWVPVDQLDQFSNEPYLIGVYEKIIKRARKV